MFESIYNTEALLLAVKLKQRFRRESEKLMPAPPRHSLAPWGRGHGGPQTPEPLQGHGAGGGWGAFWAS